MIAREKSKSAIDIQRRSISVETKLNIAEPEFWNWVAISFWSSWVLFWFGIALCFFLWRVFFRSSEYWNSFEPLFTIGLFVAIVASASVRVLAGFEQKRWNRVVESATSQREAMLDEGTYDP